MSEQKKTRTVEIPEELARRIEIASSYFNKSFNETVLYSLDDYLHRGIEQRMYLRVVWLKDKTYRVLDFFVKVAEIIRVINLDLGVKLTYDDIIRLLEKSSSVIYSGGFVIIRSR